MFAIGRIENEFSFLGAGEESALDEGRGAALFAEDRHEAGAADAAIFAAGNFDQAFLNAGGEQDVGGIEFVVWK